MDLARWLDALGVAEHLPAFEAHGIELVDLPTLTPDDLREIGLPVGPRRRVLLAAAGLDDHTLPGTQPADAPRTGAERRRMSVMFCDLVGSTPLSVQLDIEQLRDVLGAYNELVTSVITTHGGYVAKYLGDGVLAYFGWPEAAEDQTERAVRAGLEVAEHVGKLADAPRPLACRVGIATGEVVVGDMPGERAAVVGRTANLAARLQEAAAAGDVVVDGTTAELTRHAFEFGEPVETALKGLAGPVLIHTVDRRRRTRSRFDAARTTARLTPFVGRAAESTRLEDAWARASDGHGSVVTIGGDAGIGKSRLAHEFLRSLDLDDDRVWRMQCSPAHTASVLHPVLRHIEHVADLAGHDRDGRLGRLRGAMAEWPGDREATTQLVSSYLGIADPSEVPMDPAQRRSRMLQLLLDRVRQLADDAPLVVLVEDLHWSDPTTLEFARRLARQVTDQRTLVLATHRPTFDPADLGDDRVETLPLAPLAQQDARALLQSLLGEGAGDDVIDRIVARTDGNPLYVEELSPLVRGAASGELDDHVPVSLAASLVAQIDRLGRARSTAQVAAVIGREFSRDLLAALLPTDDVDAALEPLFETGLVHRGQSRGDEVTFKHALVRDAAYETLLHSERRALHERIADVLSSTTGVVVAAPEVVAQHWAAAQQLVPAAEQWLVAGRQAAAGGAVEEAQTHLGAALEVVGELEHGVRRDRLELELLLEFAPVTMATGGYAAAQVHDQYRRATELADAVGDADQRFIARWGAYFVTEIGGRWHESAANVEELLAIDTAGLRPDLPIQVHHAAATLHHATGNPRLALEHNAIALEQYDRELHAAHRLLFGSHDPAVCALGQQGLARAIAGEPTGSRRNTRDCVQLARDLDHPSTTALAWWLEAWALTVVDRSDEAREAIARTIEYSEAHGLAAIRRSIEILRLKTLEDRAAAHQQFTRRLDPLLARKQTGFLVPQFVGAGAEVAVDVGEFDRALQLATYAEEAARRSGEASDLGQILFQRGRALEAESDRDLDGAVAAYWGAVDFCRDRGMHWLEVEPACALARLLAERGDEPDPAAVVVRALSALPNETQDEPRVVRARRLATAI